VRNAGSEVADSCLVQMAYAIGVAEPVSLMLNTFQIQVEFRLLATSCERSFSVKLGLLSL